MDIFKKSAWIKAGLIAAGVDIVLSILSEIPCISCLVLPINCIAWLILPIGCGYLAAMWSELKRDQSHEAVIQGALSGLVLGVVGGTVQLIISLISQALNLGAGTLTSLLSEQDNPLMQDLAFVPLGIGGTLIFGSVCCIAGIVLNVVLSIVGGIIYVALSKK
jgi:hypothetical protein